jgi:hypothetical protein
MNCIVDPFHVFLSLLFLVTTKSVSIGYCAERAFHTHKYVLAFLIQELSVDLGAIESIILLACGPFHGSSRRYLGPLGGIDYLSMVVILINKSER